MNIRQAKNGNVNNERFESFPLGGKAQVPAAEGWGSLPYWV
jgi:hypothetical protein